VASDGIAGRAAIVAATAQSSSRGSLSHRSSWHRSRARVDTISGRVVAAARTDECVKRFSFRPDRGKLKRFDRTQPDRS
jgi:hypothetical protein